MTRNLVFILIMLLIIYFLIPNKLEDEKEKKKEEQEITEMRGIFISYIELGNYIKNKSEEESKKNIDDIIRNTKKAKFNTLFLQVRSHMDSIYNSKLFPISKNIVLNNNKSYDILDYFIKQAKKSNIDIYAWVNPYRIDKTIDENSTYYERIKDDIKLVGDTYYLNPASSNTTKLICDGIEEIVANYKVKGIIFDDYFYPSKDIDIDNYKKENSNLSIEEYRLNKITDMLYKVNKTIKNKNKKVLFGISPEGNIDNNYNKNYLDVKKIASSNKYVDFLMPQIYYGFDNETKPFIDVYKEWNEMINDKKIKLYVALALYKSGKLDFYAKNGKEEWINNYDIIKRQVLHIREENNDSGFSIFRYDNLFNPSNYTENTVKEVENLNSILY